MDNLAKLLLAMMQNPPKPIRFNVVGPVAVSTVDTIDCGLETGIVCGDAVHVVERYQTREDALQGHKEWLERAIVGHAIQPLDFIFNAPLPLVRITPLPEEKLQKAKEYEKKLASEGLSD